MAHSLWTTVAPGILTGLLFRTAPFLAFALSSSRLTLRGRAGASGAFVLLLIAWCATDPTPAVTFCDCSIAWCALLVGATAVHLIHRRIDAKRSSTPGLLMAAAILFMLLPAIFVRNSATQLLLATGFEVALSAHSYWRECDARKSKLGDCLSFLLVNPVLVYPDRGIDLGAPAWSRRAGGRVALGVVGTFFSPLLSVTAAVAGSRLADSASGFRPWAVPLAALLPLTLNLWAQYVAHSSLAHLQIGCMRLLGYSIPERYNYALLARSPDDFWRRWNTYIGSWLLRYAYLPLALRYQRVLPRNLWLLGKGAAVLCTFVVCGLLHEAAAYALRLNVPLGALLAFATYGVLLVVWTALRQLALKATEASSSRARGFLDAFGASLSRAVTVTALLLFGAVALPALAGSGLADQLRLHVP